MTDDLPSHEDIETYVHDVPKSIIDKLPDCIASRRAKQLIETTYDYAKEAREIGGVQQRTVETPSEASMRRAQESGIAWVAEPRAVLAIPHSPTGLCACPDCWKTGC